MTKTTSNVYNYLNSCCGSYGLTAIDSHLETGYCIKFNDGRLRYVSKSKLEKMTCGEIDQLVMEAILERCCE